MLYRLRSLASTSIQATRSLLRAQTMVAVHRIQPVRLSHDEGPMQPFDNLPFRVTSRYAATLVFSILFGIGLWAPFIIVWYQMAKRTL